MDRRPRAKLEGVRYSEAEGVRAAEVTLVFDGRSETGRAIYDGEGRAAELFAIAQATIAAAERLANDRFRCVVRLAEVTDVAGTEFALVNAMLQAGGRSAPVLGSSAVRGAAGEAIARATLDAVNRWLDLSLHGFVLEGFDELESFDLGRGATGTG